MSNGTYPVHLEVLLLTDFLSSYALLDLIEHLQQPLDQNTINKITWCIKYNRGVLDDELEEFIIPLTQQDLERLQGEHDDWEDLAEDLATILEFAVSIRASDEYDRRAEFENPYPFESESEFAIRLFCEVYEKYSTASRDPTPLKPSWLQRAISLFKNLGRG